MCTLTYFCRPLKGEDEDRPASLCLRVIYHRKVKTISTGYKLYPKEWNQDRQELIYPPIETDRSMFLKNVEEKISEIQDLFHRIVSLLEGQGYYTVDDVVLAYHNHSDPGLLSVFCRRQEMLLIRSGQDRTARAYRSAAKSLIQFNKNKDIPLKYINNSLIKEYERHLKERGKSLNTISFYMRNLRAIYNRAITEKIILSSGISNPFSGVYTGIDRTRKRALSLDEAVKMREISFSAFSENKATRLSRSRQIFFFCFHARGMSFIDMAYLRKENIKGGVISYYRKKTGQLIEIKLTQALKEIIDSFSQEVCSSEYVFPIITDPKKNHRLQYENGLRSHNKSLKELAKLAGLSKPISSHVSRHSWATIAKYERLPLSVISEGLGHSNEKTTYIYLASFERSRLGEANELVGEAIDRMSSAHSYSSI